MSVRSSLGAFLTVVVAVCDSQLAFAVRICKLRWLGILAIAAAAAASVDADVCVS